MRKLGVNLQPGAGFCPASGRPVWGAEVEGAQGDADTPPPRSTWLPGPVRRASANGTGLHPRPITHGNTHLVGEAGFGPYSFGFSLLLFLGWNFSLS